MEIDPNKIESDLKKSKLTIVGQWKSVLKTISPKKLVLTET